MEGSLSSGVCPESARGREWATDVGDMDSKRWVAGPRAGGFDRGLRPGFGSAIPAFEVASDRDDSTPVMRVVSSVWVVSEPPEFEAAMSCGIDEIGKGNPWFRTYLLSGVLYHLLHIRRHMRYDFVQ